MTFIKWTQKHVYQLHGVHLTILLIKLKRHVHLNVTEKSIHLQMLLKRNV